MRKTATTATQAALLSLGMFALVISPATAATSSPAPANTTQSTAALAINGDFDGDKRQDTATLNSTAGSCNITFTYGNGTHKTRTLKPQGSNVTCPNLAISAQLTANQDSLVMAWSSVSPLRLANPEAGNQNLIITDHTMHNVHVSPGIVQPAILGSADFTGDGTPNIWAWSDQNSTMTAFATDTKTPLWNICGDARSNSLYITDVTGDGAQDVVAAATMCDGKMFAASALNGKTGDITALADHTTDATSINIALTDSNGDGIRNQVTITRPQFDGPADVITKYVDRNGTWHSQPPATKTAVRQAVATMRPAESAPETAKLPAKSAVRRTVATAGLMTPQQFAQHFSSR